MTNEQITQELLRLIDKIGKNGLTTGAFVRHKNGRRGKVTNVFVGGPIGGSNYYVTWTDGMWCCEEELEIEGRD